MENKKNNSFKVFGIIALVTAAIGGTIYLWNQTKKLADFCFDFVGYKIISVGLINTVVDVYLSIKNKSNLDVIIKGYELDVYINDKFISKIVNSTPQTLPANDKSQLTLSVNFNPATLIKNTLTKDNLLNLLGDKSSIVFRFKGKLSANFAGLSVNDYPIDISSSLKDMMPDPNKQSTKCE